MWWRNKCDVRLPLVFLFIGVEASVNNGYASVSITRHHNGDTFFAQGGNCDDDFCLGMSSGTASQIDSTGCNCQCMPNLPVFRDDLHICVDDIQECTLTPFLSGTTKQKIPYVFLPLKGQIVYPSAEIKVSDVASPICVVSGAQFLGRRGWIQLRNNTDIELPFRLFRDEGKTFLQWLGEGDLRLAMEGRLILVHLMCKDASGEKEHKIFTPCIAVRVAGNPSAGVKEMMFATDRSVSRVGDKSLSVSEYVAIGVCILLLGMIYVASLFLYFYFKRKKKEKKKAEDGTRLTMAEEGIVKSNPLLQATRRHLAAVAGQDNAGYSSDSGSCCSESEKCSDIGLPDEDQDDHHQNVISMEISAMIHPCNFDCNSTETLLNQDSNNIERLPEEDVSIVETLEGKEDRPETVRPMGSANVRKKLYFNPAYFELDMLKAPPPAALEFLTKIREVITIAKHKMSAKRFSPSLIGIPEEEYCSRIGKPNSSGNRSRPTSVRSFTGSTESKRNKKSSCVCTKDETRETSFNAAANDSCCPNDAKQRIIRKWLEDMPFVKSQKPDGRPDNNQMKPVSRNNDSTSQVEEIVEVYADNEKKKSQTPPQRKETKKSTKGPAPPRPPPPPPIQTENVPSSQNAEFKKSSDVLAKTRAEESSIDEKGMTLQMVKSLSRITDDKITTNISVSEREEMDNIPRVQGKDKVPPVVAKTLMDAVIQELIVQRKGDPNIIKTSFRSNLELVQAKNARNEKFHNSNKSVFEMDSLERKVSEDAEDTADTELKESFTEKVCDEQKTILKEIDSCIDIYGDNIISMNKETIDSIIEKEEKQEVSQDDHDYEVILLNCPERAPDHEEKDKELKIYNLPEILSKNDRSEGYSLVSEVYVNDGYSYSSDGSSQSNESGKSRSSPSEKPGRLTIHVKDSPENYRHIPDETDSFEPDTLDRKPGKFRYSKTILKWKDNGHDQYSNQRFHEMDLECQHRNPSNNENFTDSLERPEISLKTSGSFRKDSRDSGEVFKNVNTPLARHFGSLREIYEARSHRRRTETSSLVGSIPSDVECLSTLSWREDRRNKLLHRGIILHINEDNRKHRRSKTKVSRAKVNYPDVVPPRPPKPPSLSGTPNQRSGISTPCTRSYCPSPTSRSACTSPPPRSNCTSPRPAPAQFPPPPPPPRSMNRSGNCPPSPRSGRGSPLPASRSICSSPTFYGRSSVSKNTAPQPPPRSLCSSPISQKGRVSPPQTYIPPPPSVTAGMKQSLPPSPAIRSACSSPVPPPRPPKSQSPPLPPRNSKPPLPPKNSKTTRQGKPETDGLQERHASSPARRPLPPIPRNYHDSTLSSISSRDPETSSMMSGASIDSLNSSDYEAFYTLPYDENEGEIFERGRRRLPPAVKNIQIFNANPGTEAVFYPGEYDYKDSKNRENSRVKKISDPVKSWRKAVRNGENFPHKLEDSGYLSTDSECGRRRHMSATIKIENSGSQGSETEESLCDGASESGAESIATDSFFFGNFNRVKTAGSLDSGVGSEVNKSFMLMGEGANPESEGRDILITVRQ